MKLLVRWLFCVCFFLTVFRVYSEDRHGWPFLKAPSGVIVCTPASTPAESMLLESLSGLAAQAVQSGKFDRMVWIDVGNPSYRRIFEKSVSALSLSVEEGYDVWKLLSYLKTRGLVKGYVLYSLDSGKQVPGRPVSDYSSNVATVYSSLMSGVLIDTSLESKARTYRLKKLKDAREKTPSECFQKHKSQLNNCSALSIHPSRAQMRDYAIAHKLMLYSNEPGLAEEVLEWVRPLSPILGWGIGDEYDATSVISEWGHYNTASDWCTNLPFITASAPSIPLSRCHEISLDEIDFTDSSYVHSFVMSDGDNMQWTMGSFVDNPVYVGHPQARSAGLSWTLCPINLSVVSPVSWNELVSRQGDKNSYIEYGGGYQYPDLFAIKRPNREELLREFARRVNRRLQHLGVTIFGAIFKDVSSSSAQEAIQIYAEELEGITGMIAIQYFPYELGKGVYWYKNRSGVDIPLITADFSLWNEVRADRPHCGTPEYVSSLINREALSSSFRNNASWTIVHAWSDFAQTSKVTPVPAQGVNPVVATESLLLDGIRTVSLNELLWRIRMKYRPSQTDSLLHRVRE